MDSQWIHRSFSTKTLIPCTALLYLSPILHAFVFHSFCLKVSSELEELDDS